MLNMGNLNEQGLVPSYLESDFYTSLVKNTELLKNSDTFRDYNYHGANMTMILELLSYLADFNSFHTNLVARNVYMESANVYETVHSLAGQKGYNALGYVSSWVTVSVAISGDESLISYDNEISVAPWQSLDTTEQMDNGDVLYYTIPNEHTFTVTSSGNYIEFDLQLRQGKMESIEYRGDDIIDNKIFLPFHDYDHGSYPYTLPSVSLFVNDEEWMRVNDFYDEISGLKHDNDNVYMLTYDRYKRYAIVFNSGFNVPIETDDLKLNLILSHGDEGVIGKNLIQLGKTDISDLVIWNTSKNTQIPVENITVFVNNDPSIGGNNPESIEELKINSRANVHSQYRNNTSKDYKYHLEGRSDVTKGMAWGEQEVDPGNTIEYNRVYFSVIPEEGNFSMFRMGTIETSVTTWTEQDDPTLFAEIEIPTHYMPDFRDDLMEYLEPRKMLNVYEVNIVPDIVYFRLDIGIRTKRTFSFIDVMNDVREKLEFFFHPTNRVYQETIDFMDIENYILDRSIVSETSIFPNIVGVDNLVIREVSTYTDSLSGNKQEVFEPNNDFNYPQYTKPQLDGYMDNKLRPIKLKYNQFPMVVIDMCRFSNEGV